MLGLLPLSVLTLFLRSARGLWPCRARQERSLDVKNLKLGNVLKLWAPLRFATEQLSQGSMIQLHGLEVEDKTLFSLFLPCWIYTCFKATGRNLQILEIFKLSTSWELLYKQCQKGHRKKKGKTKNETPTKPEKLRWGRIHAQSSGKSPRLSIAILNR